MTSIQQAAEKIYKPEMMIGPTNGIELYKAIVEHYLSLLKAEGYEIVKVEVDDLELAQQLFDNNTTTYFMDDGQERVLEEDSALSVITEALVIGRKQGEWISVNDRLPEIDEYVLWYNIEGNCFIECIDKDGLDFAYTVSHWMPLPSPPKTQTT